MVHVRILFLYGNPPSRVPPLLPCGPHLFPILPRLLLLALVVALRRRRARRPHQHALLLAQPLVVQQERLAVARAVHGLGLVGGAHGVVVAEVPAGEEEAAPVVVVVVVVAAGGGQQRGGRRAPTEAHVVARAVAALVVDER